MSRSALAAVCEPHSLFPRPASGRGVGGEGFLEGLERAGGHRHDPAAEDLSQDPLQFRRDPRPGPLSPLSLASIKSPANAVPFLLPVTAPKEIVIETHTHLAPDGIEHRIVRCRFSFTTQRTAIVKVDHLENIKRIQTAIGVHIPITIRGNPTAFRI